MTTLPKRLSGRVALVTGAGRGIGRAIAQRLLEEGANVLLVDIDRDAVEDAADEYRQFGETLAHVADVADEAAVQRAVQTCAERLGGLDVLVNNAAKSDPETGPIETLARRDWQAMVDTNLTSSFLTVKHAATHLRRRSGAIINIASTRALQSEPHTEVYAACKGALVALTHALAISLGPDIRVNAILPGWIATARYEPRGEREQPALRERDHAQHPVGRVGEPTDVAALAAYLAASESSFITGQAFVIDGGMTRKMIYAD